MKLLNFSLILFAVMISPALHSQALWVTSGSNIINNNPGGGVRVRQDEANAASVPSHGNWALFSWGSTSHTSGTASKVWGAYLLSLNHSSGTLTESIGANVVAGNESSGNGIVTNAYGVRAKVQSGVGTVANGYGVYIDVVAGTSNYGLYQSNSSNKNYFAGNVGIGTTATGSFKLAVEGKIGAREVQVTTQTPWPDYVFQDDYKLPSLSEISSFIKQNKHLPGIPSAEEIKRDGHKLGEMDVLLLKKIEELTLYIIDIKKDNEQLKKEIESLKSF